MRQDEKARLEISTQRSGWERVGLSLGLRERVGLRGVHGKCGAWRFGSFRASERESAVALALV